MTDSRHRLRSLAPLVFDDPEAIEELATLIYDLHEGVARRGACYETPLPKEMRESILGKIEAALVSVFCTYFGQTPLDRFVDIFEQVSCMAEHLAKDHIFQDGNKRTSLLLVFAILRTRHIKVLFDDPLDPDANRYYRWIQDLVSGAKGCGELAEDLRANAEITGLEVEDPGSGSTE